MKVVSILGSTGSIGCNSLKVIDHLGDFRVAALGAGRNMPKFAEQIAKYRPELVSVDDEGCAEELARELAKVGTAADKDGAGRPRGGRDTRKCGRRRIRDGRRGRLRADLACP